MSKIAEAILEYLENSDIHVPRFKTDSETLEWLINAIRGDDENE